MSRVVYCVMCAVCRILCAVFPVLCAVYCVLCPVLLLLCAATAVVCCCKHPFDLCVPIYIYHSSLLASLLCAVCLCATYCVLCAVYPFSLLASFLLRPQSPAAGLMQLLGRYNCSQTPLILERLRNSSSCAPAHTCEGGGATHPTEATHSPLTGHHI